MFLLNTTFSVTDREYGWWVQWMTETYLPQLQASAPGASHELYLVDGVQVDGARAFSSQWRTSQLAELSALRTEGNRLCQDMMRAKGEACLAFSSLMKSVEL